MSIAMGGFFCSRSIVSAISKRPAAVLGRLRPPLPGRDVPGAHGQRAQRQHSQHGGDMGGRARYTPVQTVTAASYPPKGGRYGHHRRGGRLLCRHGHRPDLRKNAGRITTTARSAAVLLCFRSSASPRTSVPASARRSSGWMYRWWTDDLNGWIFAKNRIFPLDRSGSFWYQ